MRAVQLKAERYGQMAYTRYSRPRASYSRSSYGSRRSGYGSNRGRGRGMRRNSPAIEAAFQRGRKAGMRKRRANGRRSYSYYR